MCWRLGLHPLFWILYTNCVDLVKLTPESSLRSAPSGIYVPVWSCFFHGRCVFSLAQESPEKSKKLCSRWTESDRGRERCTEALDKAAGQWGRQKLIREAASFTTPQLDHVCVFVCVSACADSTSAGHDTSWKVYLLVCVRLCLSPSMRHRWLPLLSSSIWLARPNKPHTN